MKCTLLRLCIGPTTSLSLTTSDAPAIQVLPMQTRHSLSFEETALRHWDTEDESLADLKPTLTALVEAINNDASIRAKRDATEIKQHDALLSYLTSAILRGVPPLPLTSLEQTGVRLAGDADTPHGAIVVIAGSAGGKTSWFKHLQQKFSAMATSIVWGEPEATVTDFSGLHNLMHLALQQQQPLILVDSFRKVAFQAALGGTGEGGVDNAFFSDLTDLSVTARQLGVTVVVAWNPLTVNDAKLGDIQARAAGASTGACFLSDVASTAEGITLTITGDFRFAAGRRQFRDTVVIPSQASLTGSKINKQQPLTFIGN